MEAGESGGAEWNMVPEPRDRNPIHDFLLGPASVSGMNAPSRIMGVPGQNADLVALGRKPLCKACRVRGIP